MQTPSRQQLRNKLDRIAINQLRAEVAKLSHQLEQVEKELAWSQDDAHFLQHLYTHNVSIGPIKSGDVVSLTSSGAQS